MNPIECLLLATNAVTLVAIGFTRHKMKMIEGALKANSRILASIGHDFLKAQGKTDIHMGQALYDWMNQENHVVPPAHFRR